jgi:phage shock protein PspC (stress-responsive transcriptional regulator)
MTTAPTSEATESTGSTEPELGPGKSEMGIGRGDSDRLERGGDGRMVGGVAIGLADYFDVDPTLVRIGFVALTFLGGLAIPLYLAGWLLIPEEGSESSVAEELLHHERSH